MPLNTTLTGSADVVPGTADDDLVNGLSSTLNATDSLDGGGGHDTLALFGAGTFDLSALAQFTGFEEVNLVNLSGGQDHLTLPDAMDLTVKVSTLEGGSIHLGNGTTDLTLNSNYYQVYASGDASIQVTGNGNSFFLSDGTVYIQSQGIDSNIFNFSTGDVTVDYYNVYGGTFNLSSGSADITYHDADVQFGGQGVVVLSTGQVSIDFGDYTSTAISVNDSSYLNPNNTFTGGHNILFYFNVHDQVIDLTQLANNISNDGSWSFLSSGFSGGGNIFEIDQNTISKFKSFSGEATDILQTAAATLDFTEAFQLGINIVSTNPTGTSFTVADVFSALHVLGGIGNDTLILQSSAFTEDQRDFIFATTSIETITDDSGTY